jgi:flagellar biosynthesis GTPase FlhF
MKIHIPKKIEVIRLTIKSEKEITLYINLIETSQSEVIKYIYSNFAENTIKTKGIRTTIDVRRSVGSENLESQRVSLYDINPENFAQKLFSLLN